MCSAESWRIRYWWARSDCFLVQWKWLKQFWIHVCWHLELLIFFYNFHLISSTYSHHPEMFIILLQPLHPLVIQFDYIWRNRFGAHKLIPVSSPLCNRPELLPFDGLVLDCSSSIANALELLQSCTARPSTWCPLCFMSVLEELCISLPCFFPMF